MKYTVFCDFDGTITLKDTCVELTRRYASTGWKKIEQMWIAGRHDAGELSQMLLDLIEIDEGELERFAQGIGIDPHFERFIKIMGEKGIKVYIVSDGYDVLIEPILKKNGLSNIEYYSNSISFEDGKMKAHFPNKSQRCRSCGSCKTDVIGRLKDKERTSIYIGDGHSDRCASKNGDIVFAKGALLELLEQQGKDFVKFDDFSDIIEYMNENIL